MWKGRERHAEALETNTVGFLRLRPDPGAYKTANGLVNVERRHEAVFGLAKAVVGRLRATKVVVSFVGDATVAVVLASAVEGTEILALLDEASRTHQFGLDLWGQKDPESITLGSEGQRVAEPAE